MSMNYYCKRTDFVTGTVESMHVGLLSEGRFQFRAYPEHGLISFAAWQAWLTQPGVALLTEFADSVMLDRFFCMAARKRNEVISCPREQAVYHQAHGCIEDANRATKGGYRDPEGHFFGAYDFSFS